MRHPPEWTASMIQLNGRRDRYTRGEMKTGEYWDWSIDSPVYEPLIYDLDEHKLTRASVHVSHDYSGEPTEFRLYVWSDQHSELEVMTDDDVFQWAETFTQHEPPEELDGWEPETDDDPNGWSPDHDTRDSEGGWPTGAPTPEQLAEFNTIWTNHVVNLVKTCKDHGVISASEFREQFGCSAEDTLNAVRSRWAAAQLLFGFAIAR